MVLLEQISMIPRQREHMSSNLWPHLLVSLWGLWMQVWYHKIRCDFGDLNSSWPLYLCHLLDDQLVFLCFITKHYDISNDINNHIFVCASCTSWNQLEKTVANSTWTMYHHQMAQEISCLFVSRLLWLKRPRALFSLRKKRANRKPSNGEIMVQKLLRCSSLKMKISWDLLYFFLLPKSYI